MALINSPPTGTVDMQDSTGRLFPPAEGFRNFFNAVFNICNALTMSGTTAQRPVTLLWPGRMYMDLSLNKPIWYTTGGWRDATSALV